MNGDNQLRDILPLLRPRTAEPTLFTQVVWYLLWTGLAVLLLLYVSRWIRHRRRRLAEFRAAAAAAGLDAEQTALLYRIARACRMKSPPGLITAVQVFDRQVGQYASALVARQRQHPELAAIGRIRQALGFDALSPEQPLASTRQIDRGQTLMLGVTGDADDAMSPWLLLERDEGALTVAPVLRDGGAAEVRLQPGDEVEGRFWREGDTEYHFTVRVLGRARRAHAVDLGHGPVTRMQHRDFYRIDVDFAADFLILPASDDADVDVQADAAIDLLDRSSPAVATDDIRVEAAAPDDAPGSEASDRLAQAVRVPARVFNLSAGGLAVEIAADALPGPPEAFAWVVDPAFDGPFPLAGLTCVPLVSEAGTGVRRIKMRFDELPTPVEKEIVRGVYEHQLEAAGGRGRPSTPAPPPLPEEDDLPRA